MSAVKACTRCKVVKPLSAFHIRRGDRRVSHCKVCVRDYHHRGSCRECGGDCYTNASLCRTCYHKHASIKNLDTAILHLDHFFGRGRPRTIYQDERPRGYTYTHGSAIGSLLRGSRLKPKHLPWSLIDAEQNRLNIKRLIKGEYQ